MLKLLTLGHLLPFSHPETKFSGQSEGAEHKSRTSCLQDLFGQWVIPTEAWPISNEMAVGQQIPAGLHCIIRLFWTHAPAMSELAAAIELLLAPICTQRIERLSQPCPHCLYSILPLDRTGANVSASYQTRRLMPWWSMSTQHIAWTAVTKVNVPILYCTFSTGFWLKTLKCLLESLKTFRLLVLFSVTCPNPNVKNPKGLTSKLFT